MAMPFVQPTSVDKGSSFATIPNETIYCNKQLIAHLLKVCTAHHCCANCPNYEGDNNSSSGCRNNYNHSSDHERSSSSSIGSSQFRTSLSSEESEQLQQRQHHQHSSVDGPTPFSSAISLDILKDGRTVELEQIVLHLCNEFEQLLHRHFQDFGALINTEPSSIRESVTRQLKSLFSDKFNWGRFIAVCVLVKYTCDKCLAENKPQLAAAVQQWVAEFIEQNLWDMMLRSEGWYGLICFYRGTDNTRATQMSLWSSMTSLLAVSTVLIVSALVISFF